MANLRKVRQQLSDQVPELKRGNLISRNFSKVVFSVRIKKGLTQKELASMAEVSPKTIHRLESGIGGISDETYSKVFHALDLNLKDVADFFKERETVDQANPERLVRL